MRKTLSIAGFVVAAVLSALAPALATIYREAYPAEPAKREALSACARLDPGFNRLFAGERALCYQRLMPPREEPVLLPRRLEVAAAAP
jgi:hypothetical protein